MKPHNARGPHSGPPDPEAELRLTSGAVSPSGEVTARIREQVARDLYPARGLSPIWRWLLGLAGVGATLGLVVATMGQKMLALSPARSLLVLAVGGVLLAAATFAALARREAMSAAVSARAFNTIAPLLAFFVLVLVAMFFSSANLSSSELGTGTPSALGCFRDGLLVALIPLVAFLLLWRRTDPFSPTLSGALIGGWAGVTGAIGLGVVCPASDVLHLLSGHGAAVAVGAIAGAWLGRRMLTP